MSVTRYLPDNLCLSFNQKIIRSCRTKLYVIALTKRPTMMMTVMTIIVFFFLSVTLWLRICEYYDPEAITQYTGGGEWERKQWRNVLRRKIRAVGGERKKVMKTHEPNEFSFINISNISDYIIHVLWIAVTVDATIDMLQEKMSAAPNVIDSNAFIHESQFVQFVRCHFFFSVIDIKLKLKFVGWIYADIRHFHTSFCGGLSVGQRSYWILNIFFTH